MKPIVSIIMGSQSDLKCMQIAAQVLEEFQVPYEIKIVSAHRTPKVMQSFATNARRKGIKVIIAGAGGAAHLPGMVASLTTLPVIGIPIHTQPLKGLDSLLSIAQMPKGVPVATMAIDGAQNAALMAIRILALKQSSLEKKLIQFQKQQQKNSLKSNKSIKI